MKTKHFQTAAFVLLILFSGAWAFNSTSASKSLSKANTLRLNKSILLAEVTSNLEFDYGKASVRKNYYSNLDELAKIIIEDHYALALRGHADSIGNYKSNWMLSEKRAVEVKDYLVTKGVKADQIVTTPYGSTIPIASNKTPQGRQKNRRVEIKLNK